MAHRAASPDPVHRSSPLLRQRWLRAGALEPDRRTTRRLPAKTNQSRSTSNEQDGQQDDVHAAGFRRDSDRRWQLATGLAQNGGKAVCGGHPWRHPGFAV